MQATRKTATAAGRDIYATVTNQIVAALEAGTRPWVRPWTATAPEGIGRPLRSTGEPYRGINVLLLWSAALEHGYSSRRWYTFNQAKAMGANVRRGEHGSMVVYAGRIENADADDDEEQASTPRRAGASFLRAYTVFNADQLDGLTLDPAAPAPALVDLDAGAEAYVAATGAVIRHGGSRAYYAPGPDMIQLPAPSAFRSAADYHATQAHELVHWTGHPARLQREFGQRFGDDAYAVEELVAELGAAFLCADLGIAAEPREDHAAYIANWLSVLKSDRKAVFTAATQAQKAVDYLAALQHQAEPVDA